jgi:hypothetical protein
VVVQIVTHNALLVNNPSTTVLFVLVLELTHLIAHVQITTSLKPITLANSVITGAETVSPLAAIVPLAQITPTELNSLVTVTWTTTTMVLPFVNLADHNVSDVTEDQITVTNVSGQEKTPHTVTAQPDLSMMDQVSAKYAHTNVSLVKTKLNIVSFVLETESMLQTVTVKPDSSTKPETQIVPDVLTDVTLVPPVVIVLLVKPQESTLHTATVQMVWWNLVDLKPTSFVTNNAHNQPVLIVTTDVLPVLTPTPTVSTVLETEFLPQNVTAQTEPMMSVPKFAQPVTLNVLLVLITLKTVSLVPNQESTHQFANAHMDLMTTVKPVNHVASNVNTVPPNTPVLFVLETESTLQFVTAHHTPMTTEPQFVHLVTTNVILVSTCQTTVSLVLKEESTHQSVTSQNHPLKVLKSMTFQSDLLNQSTVTADVKLVKDKETTVWLVIPTESTLQLVDALLVIMKMITALVKIVHTPVSPVPLGTIVISVKIHNTEFLPIVSVLLDTSIMVSHFVILVLSNV